MSYIYDAFISYRHSELDKFVAENLHKQLEAFTLPRNLRKNDKLKKQKIERVFRDRDELPLASNLEDPIVEALRNSEYLIVICSPRLKESIWCQKEIQTFIEMNGRQKVFAVLVEGEPEDSFPEELLKDENGNLIEPLAADVRGKNKSEVKKLIKEEMLRLLAPMFGLGYDDLKQRHKEQQLKKTAGIVSICGIVGVAFGLVCAFSAIRINSQKKVIEEQNVTLANAQAEALSEEALDLYKDDDRRGAVELAYKAMTEYEGVKMPRTALSEKTLVECLSIYSGGLVIKAGSQIETKGIIKEMKVSPSGQYVLTSDNMGNLAVWDMDSKENVFDIQEDKGIAVFDFLDDEKFFYANNAGGIQVGTIKDKSLKGDSNYRGDTFDIVWDVKACEENRFAVLRTNEISFLDRDTLDEVISYKGEEGASISKIFASPTTGIVWGVGLDSSDKPVCIAVDSKTGSKLFETNIAEGDVFDGYLDDETLYILTVDVSYEIVGGDSFLNAVDVNSGELKYSTKIKNFPGTKLYYSEAQGQSNILVSSYSELVLLDADAGNERNRYYTDAEIALAMTSDEGDFLLYQSDGLCRSIDVNDDLTDLSFTVMICDRIAEFQKTSAGLVGRKEKDDRLIIFGYVMNKDFSEYDDDVKEVAAEGAIGSAATTWANENDIPDANFAEAYIEMEDANMYLVGYVDKSLKVYNSKTKELMCEYEDIDFPPIEYYGKVNDYYLAGNASTGYLFDKDGGLRAVISNFVGLTEDGKSVVVSGRNLDTELCNVSLPVYDQENLIKRAKEFLDR